MVSLWGRLRRTVMATSAPRNSARRTIANIRSPIGMVDPCVPGLAGLLMGSNSPILLFSPAGFAVVLHRRLWLCRLRWTHLLFIELPLGHLETSGPMARHVV